MDSTNHDPRHESGKSASGPGAMTEALAKVMADFAHDMRTMAIPRFGAFVPVKHDEEIETDLSTGHRMLLPPEIVLEFDAAAVLRRRIDPAAPVRETPRLNGTATLGQTAAALSEIAGVPAEEAEDFLDSLFRTTAEKLEENGTAQIKGFGTFHRLKFVPDENLAREIDLPFAMFEPVELNDSLSNDDLDAEIEVEASEPGGEQADVPAGTADSDVPEPAPTEVEAQTEGEVLPEGEAKSEEIQAEETEETDSVETADTLQTTIESPVKPPVFTPLKGEIASHRHYTYVPEDEAEIDRRKRFPWFAAICVLAALVIGYFAGYLTAPVVPQNSIAVHDTTVVTVRDTVYLEAQPEKPQIQTSTKEKIFDTVTPTRYLATMARQYYGHMEYWVYIYKANEGRLGNPDRIRPGTRVEIPPFERYATSNDPEENLRRAQQMADEIYAPYRRK